VFDESLELLKLLLTQQNVSFSGRFFSVTDATVGPLPVKPLDIWLGGSAPEGLRRVGRFGDGWLGSFLTPAEAGTARRRIEDAAAEAGREIEDDHYGISVAVGELTPEFARSVERRRPGVDPAALLPSTWAEARARIEAYIGAGLSKFVVRPATPAFAGSLERFIDEFVAELLPLEN
jgi:probable F420-dependent oxidoreductase